MRGVCERNDKSDEEFEMIPRLPYFPGPELESEIEKYIDEKEEETRTPIEDIDEEEYVDEMKVNQQFENQDKFDFQK